MRLMVSVVRRSVLPSLESLVLEDQPLKIIKLFIARRRLSGHPVTFVDSYSTYMASSQNYVLFWTSQDPRQSLLFQLSNARDVTYRFQTDTDARGQSTTNLLREISSKRGERLAKLIWAPGGASDALRSGRMSFLWPSWSARTRGYLIHEYSRVPTVSSTGGDQVRTARTSCYKIPITM